jgi:sulfite reductase (ferredoxin)
MRLVDEEKQPCRIKIEIDTTDFDVAIPETLLEVPKVTIEDTAFLSLEKSNVIAQNKRVLRHRNKSPGDFILIRQEY